MQTQKDSLFNAIGGRWVVANYNDSFLTNTPFLKSPCQMSKLMNLRNSYMKRKSFRFFINIHFKKKLKSIEKRL
jgi:hypothetical protein